LQRFAEMEQLLRGHYGAELTEHALHMADLPAGTELLGGPGWPVMRVPLGEATLFILPGVPTLVRAKVQALFERGELPTGPGWYLTTLYTSLEESRLAGDLAAVATEFADVQIGSYPNWNRLADGALVHHVRVTFETGQQGAARAEAAKRRFAATLPPEAVIDPRTLDDQ
jgi:molybdopterin-biosynthesis enzyme MoeA-like protein